MFFFYSGDSISRTSPLSDIISGVVLDVDATLATSYSGSGQVWSNLIPAPADGSAQSAYNFTLGATSSSSTDDPTFNGTANSPSAYWGFDGGDFFEIDGTNTTFLNALHRTDVTQPFTIGVTLRNAADATTAWLMSTNDAFAWSASNRGFSFAQIPGSSSGGYAQVGDTATVSAGFAGATANTDVFLIFSYDPATTTLRRWINTTTKSTSVLTKNACVTNAIQPLRLGGRGGVYNASGVRLYNTFMTNTYIDDADVVSIINQLQTRHQRGYILPVNTVAPVISGAAEVDSVLTSTTGTWTGAYITYTYQWKRDGVDIGSATSSTYTVVSADAGKDITCAVTATNARAVTATSDAIEIPSAITRDSPLSDIVASVLMDVDATIAASYTSGQLWQNLIPTPADGSAQTAYNFTLGASTTPSTDDPTFNGTAGDPAAYWGFDGGDWFQLADVNTAFLNALARTDVTQPFTMGYIGSAIGAGLGFLGLWTANNDTVGADGIGIWPRIGANNHQFTLVGDTAAVTNNVSGVVSGTIYFVVYSYNPATTTLRRWINTSTKTEISFTKNASVTNPSGRLAIGGIATGVAKSAAGAICYSAFAANAFLDDADILAIANHYELRHERDYV